MGRERNFCKGQRKGKRASARVWGGSGRGWLIQSACAMQPTTSPVSTLWRFFGAAENSYYPDYPCESGPLADNLVCLRVCVGVGVGVGVCGE